jgi:hypothetical protein
MPANSYHDAFERLAQAGSAMGVQLVRLTSVAQANTYHAAAIEFATDGSTQDVDAQVIDVLNLAEPASATGQLPAGTRAIAVDVEGRWVIHVQISTGGSAIFPARVVSSVGMSVYILREQQIASDGTWSDKSGTANISASNMSEMSIGPGAAVDVGQKVLVLTCTSTGSPSVIHYYFDHPVYAKYLS